MSTQPPPSPMPPPMPGPPPTAPPATKSRRGCWIAALIVVLVVMGACGACFFVASKNPGALAAKSLEVTKETYVAGIGPDVPQELRTEFTAELDAYIAHLKTMTREALNALGDTAPQFRPLQFINEAFRQDKALSADELQRFIELSHAARGVSP